MKLKKYILMGLFILGLLSSFYMGRFYEAYKLRALEVGNSNIHNKEAKKEEKKEDENLSYEEEAFREKILRNKDNLFKLVNKENKISKAYKSENLVVPKANFVGSKEEDRSKVSSLIKEDLERLFKDAKKEGLDLYISCGYRSYEEQEYLYNRALEREDSTKSTLVAIPGASEHQLGLAVDFTTRSIGFQLENSFEDTREGQWLLDNAHKYGFVLRYIKGKEHITGYEYEPWHYRYIGDLELSKYFYENNLTLEEVYEKLDIE